MQGFLRRLGAAACALACASGFAQPGAPYPNKPITLVVPQSPGSVADIMARLVGKSLGDILGQPVVVENRSGASGIIGAQAVARARPDGYTLLVGSVSTHGLLSGTEKNLAYDPVKDFAAVAQINDSPLVLVVHPALGVKSLREFVGLARSRPGQLSYASTGNGSGSRFTVELLRLQERLDMIHVPYRSPMEAVRAVVAGEASIASPSIPSAPDLIRAGRLQALAVTGDSRSPLLPEVPTTAEAGYPGVVFTSWTGLFAPAGTPRAIVLQLNQAVKLALARPETVKGIVDSGASPVVRSPEAFGAFVRGEVFKWTQAARDAGIAAE
ncbi:tripartite tricarboxylate transporter substrate binding protein [Xylophilus rhododendri]|uniref:Tripartite tricarboxylate transporter substrate binding protein n=1 Tax=Xylophilus rhododendri TaxID=2697032 RepID=A0A857IZH8_9BURK|nr:tripartite tricarboxylate transporter substrate binding protein [Xylophilus rhododendri]QHI96717.1 tripartite tricarboxylate transporter substrate binding protein [Xylophilus rhododendri]